MPNYKNLIVGEGDEPIDDILFNESNWRIHPKEQQDALAGVFEEVGTAQRIIINLRTSPEWGESQNVKTLVDGHARVLIFKRHEEVTIPSLYIDATPNEEAIILSTFDPIGAMAATDKQKLEDVLNTVESDNDQMKDLIDAIARKEGLDMAKLGDEKYTRNVNAPIYTPKGEKPNISELSDDTKTLALIAEIDASELPENEKEFLRLAACRHTVFDYRNIAEYYAQSDPPMQKLMEDSALIIIDFGRAIELGYVKLSEDVAEQYRKDYPHD